jgi:uncharacterized protein (TIGR03435 family)
MMLWFAYRLSNGQMVPDNRVIGGPNCMNTDHFDVEAKPEPGIDSIRLDRFLLMVQSLLEDRFQLRTHWDTRELPVYDLVVGKDGPKMKKSESQTQLSPAARNPVAGAVNASSSAARRRTSRIAQGSNSHEF